MNGNISKLVTVLLFAAFVWCGWEAHWFDVMWIGAPDLYFVWNAQTWAIFFLACLICWIGRNEFVNGKG